MSRGAYVDQESITEVRYRRHHNRGTALFGTALGLFALGAAGALANDYDDNYYAPYDGSYYPTYRYGYGYPGGGYYRGYRHPGYGAYRGHYPVNRQYYGSRQRGWEHHGWNR